MARQRCPICRASVTPNKRYPAYACDSCAERVVSPDGRPLVFGNVDISGGFEARYADSGETYGSHICVIDGVNCRADEAKFGGIVIQPTAATAPRKIEGYFLNLAGEYRICSELNKRGVFATITYGTRKGADVYAIGEHGRAMRIEVKTSQRKQFVTGISQKSFSDGSPDFWVLFLLRPMENGGFEERFFVLTHEEACKAQRMRNAIYAEKYVARHGIPPDFSSGVDNLKIEDVEEFEDQWEKIVALCK